MTDSLVKALQRITGNQSIEPCPEYIKPFCIRAINELFTSHAPVTLEDEIAIERVDLEHNRIYVSDYPEHIMICEL